MGFITVTTLNGIRIINISHIIYIEEQIIHLSNGEKIYIKEDIETIKDYIRATRFIENT